MCGRYADFRAHQREIERGLLQIRDAARDLRPSYNVAPTQQVAIIFNDDGGLVLDAAKWGLVPSWSRDATIGPRLINARGETVAEKPSFRTAFAKRRAVLPADGYLEWQVREDGKHPHFIHPAREDRSLLFAGLYELWRPPEGGDWLMTCTIVTTAAQGAMREIHDRQPVMLDDERMAVWLDDSTGQKDLEAVITAPAPELAWHEVSRAVGNVRNNTAENIEPMLA